jgi:hypothetical protein
MEAPPGVACMDTRHPRRLLAPEQVLMRFSIIYDRPSVSCLNESLGRGVEDTCRHEDYAHAEATLVVITVAEFPSEPVTFDQGA